LTDIGLVFLVGYGF